MSNIELPLIGVIMICSALAVDGVIGNVQQNSFAKLNCTVSEMVCRTKGVAAGKQSMSQFMLLLSQFMLTSF